MTKHIKRCSIEWTTDHGETSLNASVTGIGGTLQEALDEVLESLGEMQEELLEMKTGLRTTGLTGLTVWERGS